MLLGRASLVVFHSLIRTALETQIHFVYQYSFARHDPEDFGMFGDFGGGACSVMWKMARITVPKVREN